MSVTISRELLKSIIGYLEISILLYLLMSRLSASLIEFEKYVSEPRTETVLNVDELRQRMDIVLYGSRITEDDRNEGLIVELKAPSVKLSVEVLQQIERYANIVRKEPRFSGNSRCMEVLMQFVRLLRRSYE